MAEEIEPVCDLCDGCGEVEAHDAKGERVTVPCPSCVSRELNAEIDRLKIIAGAAVDGVDLVGDDDGAVGQPVRVVLDAETWGNLHNALNARKLIDTEASKPSRAHGAGLLVPLMPLAFVEGDL